ncbi:MAG: hypothetical protein EHM45_16655 [Desulfobacteraceae bacterium]|nr:MAG: hypothetical protein EHM45_16655 [Desulfobacteraceae bacterium]
MNRLLAKVLKTGRFLGMSLISLFVFYAPVFAGGAEAEGGTSGEITDLIKRILNFTLLLVVLIVVVKKAGLKNFFSARTEEIRQRLTEMKKSQAQAEDKYRLLEEKLKAFELQSHSILEQYRVEGAALKERMLAEARQKAAQIIAQAERTVQQETRAVAERIKEDLGRRAVQKAEDLISKELTDQDQDRLVNEFMERIKKVQC